MKSDILEDLIHHEIRNLYSAEKQLALAWRKLVRAACHAKLLVEFNTRLSDSGAQMKRLEQVARCMGISLNASRCQGMKQLCEEVWCRLPHSATPAEQDAVLISAARLFGDYEVESYTMACTLISRLGLDGMERLLQSSLREKKAAATRLARLAKCLRPASRSLLRKDRARPELQAA